MIRSGWRLLHVLAPFFLGIAASAARVAPNGPSVALLLQHARDNRASLEGLGLRPHAAIHRQYTVIDGKQQAGQTRGRIGTSRVHEPSVAQLLRNADKNRADLRRLGDMASALMHQVSYSSRVLSFVSLNLGLTPTHLPVLTLFTNVVKMH